MRSGKRFEVKLTEGSAFSQQMRVIVDTQTGVNYLFVSSGYSGGLCPLLDREGKPVVTQTYTGPEY